MFENKYDILCDPARWEEAELQEALRGLSNLQNDSYIKHDNISEVVVIRDKETGNVKELIVAGTKLVKELNFKRKTVGLYNIKTKKKILSWLPAASISNMVIAALPQFEPEDISYINKSVGSILEKSKDIKYIKSSDRPLNIWKANVS